MSRTQKSLERCCAFSSFISALAFTLAIRLHLQERTSNQPFHLQSEALFVTIFMNEPNMSCTFLSKGHWPLKLNIIVTMPHLPLSFAA
jgi:hypothetical protein